MGDDKTRGSGSIIGSEHGPVGHMVTHGRARLEQKEGKSSAETGIAPTGGVPHWRTLTKPELSGVRASDRRRNGGAGTPDHSRLQQR